MFLRQIALAELFFEKLSKSRVKLHSDKTAYILSFNFLLRPTSISGPSLTSFLFFDVGKIARYKALRTSLDFDDTSIVFCFFITQTIFYMKFLKYLCFINSLFALNYSFTKVMLLIVIPFNLEQIQPLSPLNHTLEKESRVYDFLRLCLYQ